MNSKYRSISSHTSITRKNRSIMDLIVKWNELTNKQVYLITKPLIGGYSYNYDDVLIILIPDHQISIINCSKSIESFNLFVDDFIEDLGHLSDHYQYNRVIGRPREWRRLIATIINKQMFHPRELDNYHDKYVSNLLISLLIGSINDVSRVNINDHNIEQVKLFNTYCLHCLYSNPTERGNEFYYTYMTNGINILLHKLSRLVVEEPDSRIGIMCESQESAQILHNDIISFFNFMRVNKQIEWGKHITLMTTWGTWADKYDGMFQYIQRNYHISPYILYDLEINKKGYPTPESFIKVCGDVYNELGNQKIQKTFDYLFINGDFPQGFIKLCLLTTKSHIFII